MNRKERIDMMLKDIPIPPETSDDRILEKTYTIPWFASEYNKEEESLCVKRSLSHAEEQQPHDAE